MDPKDGERVVENGRKFQDSFCREQSGICVQTGPEIIRSGALCLNGVPKGFKITSAAYLHFLQSGLLP